MNAANSILNLMVASKQQVGQVKQQSIELKQSDGGADFSSKLKEASDSRQTESAKAEKPAETGAKEPAKTTVEDELKDMAEDSVDEVAEEAASVPQTDGNKQEDAEVTKADLEAAAAILEIPLNAGGSIQAALQQLQQTQQQAAVPAEAVQTQQAPVQQDMAAIQQVMPEQTGETVKAETPFVAQVMQEVSQAVKAEGQQNAAVQADTTLQDNSGAVKVMMAQQTASEESMGQQQDGQKEDAGAAKAAQTFTLNQTQNTQQTSFVQQAAQPEAVQQAEAPQQVQQTFMGRLVEQVYTAATTDKSELFIQLKPEHLGGLSIALTLTEKGLTARLTTSSTEVQYILNTELSALQQSLRDKGVNMVQMEIVYDQMANMAGREFSRGGQGGQSSGTHRDRSDEIEAVTLDMQDVLTMYGSTAILEPESSREFNA